MPKKTKKDVVKKEETSTAVAPATQQARGLSDEDTTELLLPRIELLQAMSPAVQSGLGKAGELVNQITKSPLSTNIFIPIAMHRKFIKWIPRNEGGGVEYQTTDPKDPRVVADTQWGPHGEKPSCTKYLNFLVLLEGETLPIVLSFAMTSFQTGRKLYTMCKMAGGDIWNKKYKLLAQSKTNQMGTFFVFDVQEAGATGEREKMIAEQLYDAFSKRDLKFDMENDQSKAPAQEGEDF